ncbi:hypothetical protein [Prochlorothrix hollandica]|uniref:Gas vesicle protein n=1 Tax=Prochlorothrix hollandica PCC 9006 = CALU 1027 TaxID=317619 RepID=A0A0M2PZ17_PROHO|nr:hypothetical protein [Prochlorothrix hollandica]KKJ01390.1 hypothetical protein PROH_03330 [Prochlorothrix hollandica PCC 9006 = CALU 1027]
MSQSDNFAGGFLTGAIFGGIVGGIVGVALASRYRSSSLDSEALDPREGDDATADGLPSSRRRIFRDRGSADSEESTDVARRSLEDKIAQLNEGIDNLRLQLEETHPPDRPTNGSPFSSEQ